MSPTTPTPTRKGIRARSLKLAALRKTLKPPPVHGDAERRLAGDRLGRHARRHRGGRRRAAAEGHSVSSLHLIFLQPMPPGLKEIMQRFKKVMTIEGNWSDRPRRRNDRRGQPPLLALRHAVARPHADRRGLLERGEGPADQPGAIRRVLLDKLHRVEGKGHEHRRDRASLAHVRGAPQARGLSGRAAALVFRLRRQCDTRRRAAPLPR